MVFVDPKTMETFPLIRSLATLALILLGEFPTCLGVYEHIRNRASLSDTYPYFDATSERNVTSFVGQVTHLHCTVRDIGDRTVSWIRKADLHVLTSDVLTFTGDQRFSAHHPVDTDAWTLQIKYTQLRDAGEYQCQVNTEPKISFSVFLQVEEAEARIDSPSNKEVHVKQRSQVKLTCAVDLGTGTGSQSAAVFWYLDGQALDWLGQTGPGRGVRVTERRGRQLISTLIIENADMHHAGKFTCAPSYAKPDTVTLHVIDGESRAELQGNGDASTAAATSGSLATSASFQPSLIILTTSLTFLLTFIQAQRQQSV
eukprot:02048.XXX_16624_4782_1 [CDS] Oithona nana genome sequencing.